MIHGVLHLCGHKDKTKEEEENMRSLENKYLN
jgi:ssRNA-specific RNase YbeY (16S rRNA maturation enzyme)